MSKKPQRIERLVLSIATNQFKVPLPTGKDVVTAVNERPLLLAEIHRLREAAKLAEIELTAALTALRTALADGPQATEESK